MTESWEEKTERMEREYQARIDRLREELDCGQNSPCTKSPGCNRHWEERNRELVQRLAELKESHQDRQSWRTRKAIEQGNQEREDLIGTENAALKKRVAWLEGVVESKEKLQAWLEKTLTEANSRITNLTIDFLSQLETKDKRVAELERCMQEVGLLAFMRDAAPGDITAHMTRVMDSYVQRIADLQSQLAWTPVSAGLPTEPGLYEFYDVKGRYMLGIYELTPGFRWLSFDGDTWAVVEFEDYTKKIYTHYRRIELPKDGET